MRSALVILCAILYCSCGKGEAEEIDFGTIDNSVYRNKYFGLTITIPTEWSIQDQESREQVMETGTEIVAGDDKNLKAVVKASELRTVNLLIAFEHPVGAPVAFNPGIACVAEQIRHMPGIKRGSDYLFHARKILESSQMDVTFPEDISTENLGGIEFDILHVQISLLGNTIQQKYYVAVMKDYALSFIVSYMTEKESEAIGKALDSINFE
jgi:hypothetical protein